MLGGTVSIENRVNDVREECLLNLRLITGIEKLLKIDEKQRTRLKRGFKSFSDADLHTQLAELETKLAQRRLELDKLRNDPANLDPQRANILRLRDELNRLNTEHKLGFRETYLPKGFHTMAPDRLVELEQRFASLIECRREEIARAAAKAEADAKFIAEAAARRAEAQAISARIQTLVVARKTRLETPLKEYLAAVILLEKHPVFVRVQLRLPVDVTMRFTEFSLARISENEFLAEEQRITAAIAVAKRRIYGELKRAWQSASDRRLTRLPFKEYVTQEGFAALL